MTAFTVECTCGLRPQKRLIRAGQSRYAPVLGHIGEKLL